MRTKFAAGTSLPLNRKKMWLRENSEKMLLPKGNRLRHKAFIVHMHGRTDFIEVGPAELAHEVAETCLVIKVLHKRKLHEVR